MFNFFKFITASVMIMGLFSTSVFAVDENSKILRLGSHLNFDNVNVGESTSRELMLYNDGDSNLTIYGLRFHEKIEAVYHGSFSGVIVPGGSQSITITFTPIEDKLYSGLVYVDSDRTNTTNDRSRVLKGTGVDIPDSTRILAFGSHLNFGDVNVGESETRELILYNEGNTILTINGLRFHKDIEGIYTGNFSGEIPVAGSQSVTITFTPTESKRYSGLVYVVSNRTNEGETSRSLVGTGIGADITTRILTFEEHLDFGNVALGKSTTKMLVLHNEGNSDLTVSSLKFHENLEGAYTGNFSGIIPAGDSKMIPITFTPTEEKLYSGRIYVNSDRTNEGDRSRVLKGLGINPVAECSGELANRVLKFGTHLDFGTVSVGSSTTRNLMLYNEGNCDLTVEKLKFHEDLEGVYTGNFSGIITAGGSESVILTFTPKEEKSYNGLVYVTSDKTNSGDRSRLLTGSGE